MPIEIVQNEKCHDIHLVSDEWRELTSALESWTPRKIQSYLERHER